MQFYVWQIPGSFALAAYTTGEYEGDRATPSLTPDEMANWIRDRIIKADYAVEIYDLDLAGTSSQGTPRRGKVVLGQYRYMVLQETGQLLGFIQIGHKCEIEFVSSFNFRSWHHSDCMLVDDEDFPPQYDVGVVEPKDDPRATIADYMALWAQTHCHG